jgi:hypothetical protein
MQLVLNLLRGINARFATTADIIANTSPPLDFKSAMNMLRVKELRLGTEGKEASASALGASTTSYTSCTSLSYRSISSATCNCGGSGKGKGGKGKGGRGGNDSSGSGSGDGRNQQHGMPHGGVFGGRQASQLAGPWVCDNPWAAQWPPQQQQWGAPPAPPPQSHTAFAPYQFSTASPPMYGTPGGWDPTSLIAALNQMAVQGSSPWVMESGATSHMSSNDGILLSRLPSPTSSITFSNGQSIPVLSRGTSVIQIADRSFRS